MLAWAVPAWSGTAQASFAVQIQLINSGPSGVSNGASNVVYTGGYCINQLLSEQNNAVVTVVCNSNQFVSINAQPGKSFLGTHGGANLFPFVTDRTQTRSLPNSGDAGWLSGYGSSSSMRIFFTDNMQELREMLVTF